MYHTEKKEQRQNPFGGGGGAHEWGGRGYRCRQPRTDGAFSKTTEAAFLSGPRHRQYNKRARWSAFAHPPRVRARACRESVRGRAPSSSPSFCCRRSSPSSRPSLSLGVGPPSWAAFALCHEKATMRAGALVRATQSRANAKIGKGRSKVDQEQVRVKSRKGRVRVKSRKGRVKSTAGIDKGILLLIHPRSVQCAIHRRFALIPPSLCTIHPYFRSQAMLMPC